MAKFLQRSVCTILLLFLVSILLPLLMSVEARGKQLRETHEHGDEEHFVEIGNYLLDVELTKLRTERDFAANQNQNITFDEVRLLVETVFTRVGCDGRVGNCSKCQDDFTSDVFAALDIDQVYGLDEDSLLRASPLLLYGTYDMVTVCQAGPGGTDLRENVVVQNLKSVGNDGANDTLTETDLDAILNSIGEEYTEDTNANCFNVESVFDETVNDHEAGANDDEIRSASEAVIDGLLQGYCIGEATVPATAAFTDAVFDSYATSGVITEQGFAEILTVLDIGGSTDGHDVHALDHSSARRRRRRRQVAMETGVPGRSLAKRASTVAVDNGYNDTDIVPNVTQTCFTGEELLDIFGIDHEAGMTEVQFNKLSPALVQQILSGTCSGSSDTPSTITTAQTWGYGTLAVAIISSLALVGGLFIPCMSEGVYEKTIQVMIALAVATLTADAILHLLPQAVGLHPHDEDGVHTPTSPELTYIWKCFVVEMSIYALFVFEQITSLTSCFSHSHNVGPDVEMSGGGSQGRRRTRSGIGSFISGSQRRDSTKELTELAKEEEPVDEVTPVQNSGCCIVVGCNPIAAMVVLGDSLHNFGDGLAIGAAFTLSISAGLSTSIAVLCHELPHELGDLAVLLNQGMRLPTALLLNLMCACMAFAGLWVGIPLAQSEEAREWIFAAVAGMFLYVGLVDMLPMLHNYKGKTSKMHIAVLQNIGFLLGIGIMLIIALYEDAISFS